MMFGLSQQSGVLFSSKVVVNAGVDVHTATVRHIVGYIVGSSVR